MNMNTVNQANTNISNLIDEVIDLKKDVGIDYCCHFKVKDYKGCSGHCIICKAIYYNQLHDKMINMYSIKEAM